MAAPTGPPDVPSRTERTGTAEATPEGTGAETTLQRTVPAPSSPSGSPQALRPPLRPRPRRPPRQGHERRAIAGVALPPLLVLAVIHPSAGISFLRSTPLGSSPIFAGKGRLGVHPLDPPRPPFGCLERLRVVAGVAPHLPLLKLHDGHVVDRLTTVVGNHLRHPQPLPHHHSAQPHGRGRGRHPGTPSSSPAP
jgi:hypothetical protein